MDSHNLYGLGWRLAPCLTAVAFRESAFDLRRSKQGRSPAGVAPTTEELKSFAWSEERRPVWSCPCCRPGRRPQRRGDLRRNRFQPGTRLSHVHRTTKHAGLVNNKGK
jgi:hypothetical protein